MKAGAWVSCSILRHPVYRNERAVRLLVHLMLIMAEDEALDTSDGARAAGVITRSVNDLALSLRWHRSKVVRALSALQAADAVRARAVSGGTEITCLYYVPMQQPTGSPKRKPKEETPKRTTQERTERFTSACSSIWDADPARLPEPLRVGFHNYWTESNKAGKMRFESQPFFDHARRMDTWRRNAEARGFKSAYVAASSRDWNPRR